MNTQERLALALEKEKETLPEKNIFGDNNNLKDYDAAISYLRTGKIPKKYQDNELLMGVIEDFDMMCSDYGI